jgi:hypothetical protein
MIRLAPLLVVVLAAGVGLSQSCDQLGNATGDEGRVHSDFCREWLELHPCREQEAKPCNTFTFGHIADIAQTLATGQPLHIALGNLAPQNGFAAGLAFVEHKDLEDEWRLTFNTDAVASPNGSWRAGGYVKAFRLGSGNIVVVKGPGRKQAPLFHVSPLLNLYAETDSLNLLYFYGLGPDTMPDGQAAYGLTETIAGSSAIVPISRAGLSLYAEFNGRVPQLRGNQNESVPSIGLAYNEATAPGLTVQPAFLQPGVGIRIQPAIFNEHLRLHYLAEFQNFIGAGGSGYNFRRWTTDLGHEFPLDKKVHLTSTNDQNGPDSCTTDPSAPCPSPTHVSSAINHEGSIDLRLLLTGSVADAHNVVPFYFDPTLGGSDINGQPLLPSYPDYRFRAPNLVLIRETVEHAIPKVPMGAYFSADEGKVGLRRDDINFSDLRRSYTVGLTVHAGGLPVVYLLYSWGGGEGQHTTFTVSDVLLGASARPSLF